MGKFVTVDTIGVVVTDPQEEYLGAFESLADAEAFVQEYHKRGLLRLRAFESRVLRYATTDGI